MKIDYQKGIINLEGKVITRLDRFVLDFLDVLRPHVDYVVVNDFVAILFGRTGGREDIDVLIEEMDFERFLSFFDSAEANGFSFINPEDEEGLYEMLDGGLGIRLATSGAIVPNIELKFVRDDFDRYSLTNRIKVTVPGGCLYISPIEIQIPYRLWLGSERDIEDAVFPWEIFREEIDRHLLSHFMDELGVRGEEYGIGI